MLGAYQVATSAGYLLALPVIKLLASRGSRLWQERMGYIDRVGEVDLWLHASSAGEARVLGYLAEYLLQQRPKLKIHVTSMTATGQEYLSRTLAGRVSRSYFPLDVSRVMNRFLQRIKPSLIICIETEIWPNLVRQASDRSIPIVLANGRMSGLAHGRYGYIRSSISRLLSQYDHFFFRSEEDAERYHSFGISEDRVTVAGNMKFDAPLPHISAGRRAEMRRRLRLNQDDFALVAGSTREGEEQLLIDNLKPMLNGNNRFRLILAPRHVERVGDVESILQRKGLRYTLYQAERESSESITVVNQFGVLNDLYQAADAAFVGGTLVNVGGHNLLEPVWSGVPTFFGPFIDNVRDAAGYIEDHHYGQQVASGAELCEQVSLLKEGKVSFDARTGVDVHTSPTAIVGDYVLSRINNA